MIDETVIDTRKKDKNVVIISEERYAHRIQLFLQRVIRPTPMR